MAVLNGADIYFALLKGQGFEHKGDYDAAAVYEKTPQRVDCVTYEGATYYVRKTAPAGTLPTNAEYFGVLAKGGEDTEARADIAEAQTDIATAQTDIAAAQVAIAAAQADIAQLIEDVAQFQSLTVASYKSDSSAKGHIKFSNGLIINWGGGGQNLPVTNNSFTFDCPFTTTNYGIVATHGNSGSSAETSAVNAIMVTRTSNTTFHVKKAFDSTTEGIFYIAIGF